MPRNPDLDYRGIFCSREFVEIAGENFSRIFTCNPKDHCSSCLNQLEHCFARLRNLKTGERFRRRMRNGTVPGQRRATFLILTLPGIRRRMTAMTIFRLKMWKVSLRNSTKKNKFFHDCRLQFQIFCYLWNIGTLAAGFAGIHCTAHAAWKGGA